MKQLKTVALVGLGAIGCFCAPRLHKALGDDFYVIADGERAQRIRSGTTINGEQYHFPVKSAAEGTPADLIFIAVKRPALGEAFQAIRQHVGSGTIILPLLNGLDSERQTRDTFPQAHVLYALMRSSVKRQNGDTIFDPALGYMEFGEADNRVYSEQVLAVQALCDKTGLRYKIREDMLLALWQKFLSNTGENLPCALVGAPVAALQRSEHAKALQFGGMREVVAVANAKGIPLTEQDCESVYEKTNKQNPANRPSTLQDLEAARITEIEMFSGELIRMAEECGLRVPYNEVFYHAISALEEKNAGLFRT